MTGRSGAVAVLVSAALAPTYPPLTPVGGSSNTMTASVLPYDGQPGLPSCVKRMKQACTRSASDCGG